MVADQLGNHYLPKTFFLFQKRLQCTLKGGICSEPQSKYESFQKTMQAARERARKSSNFLSGTSARNSMRKSSAVALRKSSAVALRKGSENNNQGFVNYGGSGLSELPENIAEEENPSMTETEKNLKLRMRKRDAIMRYHNLKFKKIIIIMW